MDLERLLVEQPNRQDALFAVVAVAVLAGVAVVTVAVFAGVAVVTVAVFAGVAVFTGVAVLAGVAVVTVAVVAADLDFRPRLALGVSSLK